MKLDLACGNKKKEGFTGVDIAALPGVDIVQDLEKTPWPFEDNSIDEIYCSHYIEHTPDLIKFMDECYRILRPDAQMTIIAPYYTSMRAVQDPTHKRSIAEYTMFYFNKERRREGQLEHYGIKSDFDFTLGYFFSQEWINRSEEAKQFAVRHYWNVVEDIQFTLTKKVRK